MTWTKLGDTSLDDPALLELPRGVRLMHVEALVWCNRHGTDGVIAGGALRRLTDEADPGEAAQLLCVAGVWELADGGWRIVDFLKDQPSAADVERSAKLTRERQRRKRQHGTGDHSLCDPRYCAATSRESSRESSPVTNGGRHGSPSRTARPARPATAGSGGEAHEPIAPTGALRSALDVNKAKCPDCDDGGWIYNEDGSDPRKCSHQHKVPANEARTG